MTCHGNIALRVPCAMVGISRKGIDNARVWRMGRRGSESGLAWSSATLAMDGEWTRYYGVRINPYDDARRLTEARIMSRQAGGC